jgi:hypothetical protein
MIRRASAVLSTVFLGTCAAFVPAAFAQDTVDVPFSGTVAFAPSTLLAMVS